MLWRLHIIFLCVWSPSPPTWHFHLGSLSKLGYPNLKGLHFFIKAEWRCTVSDVFWGSSMIFSKLPFGTWHVSTTSDLSHLLDSARALMSKCKDMAKADLSRWPILRKGAYAPQMYSRHRNRRTMSEDSRGNKSDGIKQNTWPKRRSFSSSSRAFCLVLGNRLSLHESCCLMQTCCCKFFKENAGLNPCNAIHMQQDHL